MRERIKIDLETPLAWRRNKLFQFGRQGIAVIAFAPSFWAVGIEAIYRNAYGVGLFVGPFLFILAVSKED